MSREGEGFGGVVMSVVWMTGGFAVSWKWCASCERAVILGESRPGNGDIGVGLARALMRFGAAMHTVSM